MTAAVAAPASVLCTRRAQDEAQDHVDTERNRLLDETERALQGTVSRRRVLVVRWTLVG